MTIPARSFDQKKGANGINHSRLLVDDDFLRQTELPTPG